MAALLGHPLPATGLLHLAVSVAFASSGALCDFVAVPAFDVLLGRDLSASDHVRQRMHAMNLGCLRIRATCCPDAV